MSLGLLIECPVCSYRFSGHDRPTHKMRLMYAEVTCPHCRSQLRPGLVARAASNVLLVMTTVAIGGFFLHSGSRDLQAISIAVACIAVGMMLMILRRLPWEIIVEGNNGPGERVEREDIREANVSLAAPLPEHTVIPFAEPVSSRFERTAGTVLGAVFVVLFIYLAHNAPNTPLTVFFYGIAGLSMVVAIVLWVRPPRARTIEIDRTAVRWMYRDIGQSLAWNEIRRVSESFFLHRITLTGRRGQRIALRYRIENFAQLRDILLERLAGYFASLPARKIYRRYSTAFFTFGLMGLLLMCVAGAALWLRFQTLPAMLVVLPIALAFCFVALRQVRGVEVGATGIWIRRYVGAATFIDYRKIRELYIDENLDAFLAVKSVSTNNTAPGLVITTHDGNAHALTMLANGPMELYFAIKRNLKRKG